MLDEPVSALDPFGRREVLELLKTIKKETTILFSTHILNDAEEVCDEILFLHNGQIVESGTMEELRTRHKQSKIDLIFQNNAEEYASLLDDKDLVDSLQIQGNKASISVKNIDQARHIYLKKSIENNWPLIKFEISSMTLEDVFMKVVGK
jgi:ABC-2 type transport system ATP-binding protein